MAESDNCDSIRDRIRMEVMDHAKRHAPHPQVRLPFMTGSLSDPFEERLYTIVKLGGRDLVRCEVEVARRRYGRDLLSSEIDEISYLTFSWLKKLWFDAGDFELSVAFQAQEGLDPRKSTMLRLENAVHDEARSAAGLPPGPNHAGELPATQRTLAEESRSAASPTESDNTLPGGGTSIPGIKRRTMDRPDPPNPFERLLSARVPEFARSREAIKNPEKADAGHKAILALVGTLYPVGASIIDKLPQLALMGIAAETAAYLADYRPKFEQEAHRSGPIRDAELLRELVIHQFSLVARECMAVCASAEEFEVQLRWDIAWFVCIRLSQYGWLSDSMMEELDAGFTLFVTWARPWAYSARAQPWVDSAPEPAIMEDEETSRVDATASETLPGRYADFARVAGRQGYQVGTITCKALSHLALKLVAEAWKRAAEGGFSETHSDQPVTGADTGNSTDDPEANAAADSEELAPGLRKDLIIDWMEDEGWTNKTLAQRLDLSERVISSMRNNGKYHGKDAVTKLANLMERDPIDLYLP